MYFYRTIYISIVLFLVILNISSIFLKKNIVERIIEDESSSVINDNDHLIIIMIMMNFYGYYDNYYYDISIVDSDTESDPEGLSYRYNIIYEILCRNFYYKDDKVD